MWPTRGSLHIERHIETASERIKKKDFMQMKRKLGQQYLDKTDFQTKTVNNKRQRRELRNNKGINLTREYNTCQHLRTQCGST